MNFIFKSRLQSLTLTAGAFALLLGLAACEAKVATRGNLPQNYKLDELKPGQSDKNEVANLIGTPSTVGTFDQNTWYYISRKTEQWAFFEPELTEQKVVVLQFTGQNILKSIQHYTKEDLRQIVLQARETPTSGNELGILEQMLGNFGKFN